MSKRWTRRRVVAGASVAIGGLAGCIGGPGDDGDGGGGSDGDTGGAAAGSDGGANDSGGSAGDSDDSDGDGSGVEDSDGEDGDGDGSSDDSEDGDLDLAEANVTDVAIEEVGDREFEFSVTLYHDDEGEDGYADWWAVETRDVDELARRELSHAHGTEEFTRSATIEIPEDIGCVVVRGHDQTHEYGGQAMLVSIPSGETDANQQGSDPSAFADADCP